MKSIITLLLVCLLNVYGSETICLEKDVNTYSTVSFQRIYEDPTTHLSLDQAIMRLEASTLKKHSTPATKSAYWISFSIKNCTDTPKEIIIKHPRSGLDIIDVFIFKSTLLVESLKMGDLRPSIDREFPYRYSLFKKTIAPNESYTIISRTQGYAPYELYWIIEDIKYFTFHAFIEFLFWGFFGGILLSLIFYNISLFIHLKEKAFIAYSVHILSMLWHQYAANGILYQYCMDMNLEFLTISVLICPYVSLCSLFVFTYYFFKLQSTILGKILILWAFITGIVTLFYLFALKDMTLLYTAPYLTPIGFIAIVFILCIAVFMFYKNALGSSYFLIGQAIYVGCSVYYFMTLSAYVEANQFTWLTLPFGIVCDSLLLSFALGRKVRHIKEENEKHQRIILEQSRFYAIGQTVGNITHQWKAPLSQLSSQFMSLQATFNHHPKIFLEEFQKKIPQIKGSITYMQENIDMFNGFYKNSNQEVSFNPQKEIDIILKILDTKIMLGKIDVKVNIEVTKLHGRKSAFSNIVMILLENSIEALLDKEYERHIAITLVKEAEKSLLCISDNAGGIDIKLLDNLFVSSVTSKINQGCGFGLFMAKNLAEKQLGGTITVENSKEGAHFRLIF